jgi:hypothetical protein
MVQPSFLGLDFEEIIPCTSHLFDVTLFQVTEVVD